MEALQDALQEVVDRVQEAGVSCVMDATDLEVPGSFVEIAGDDTSPIAWNTVGGDSYELTVTLYLVAPDNGVKPALTTLSGLLEKVRRGLPEATAARPMRLGLQNHGPDLPALAITLAPYRITPSAP